jgi:hypothetical protein
MQPLNGDLVSLESHKGKGRSGGTVFISFVYQAMTSPREKKTVGTYESWPVNTKEIREDR